MEMITVAIGSGPLPRLILVFFLARVFRPLGRPLETQKVGPGHLLVALAVEYLQ